MLVAPKKKRASPKRSAALRPPDGHIRVESKVQPAPYFRWKEFIERSAALILLIPGLPLMGLLALLVRLHSRGPAIYRQDRVGKNARIFVMYKIRTMRLDAEDRSGPVWAKTNDRRITWLGRFLRKVHLDELPQLINVVKGEMALIGPRPERPEIVSVLTADIRGYTNRLVVLPGVTGLAQINLPPDASMDDVRRKLVLDLEYIKHAGLWLDARIFLSTLVRLVGLPGASAMRLFGLHRATPPMDNGHQATPAGHDGYVSAPACHNGNGNGNGNGSDGMKALDTATSLPSRHKPR